MTRLRLCLRLPKCHYREQADDANEDDANFERAQTDVGERANLAARPDDGKQRHCRADNGDGADRLAGPVPGR